jgi:hypothetical protein
VPQNLDCGGLSCQFKLSYESKSTQIKGGNDWGGGGIYKNVGYGKVWEATRVNDRHKEMQAKNERHKDHKGNGANNFNGRTSSKERAKRTRKIENLNFMSLGGGGGGGLSGGAKVKQK